MAAQIEHPLRGVPNFKRSVRERKATKPSFADKRPGMSDDHLALIRKLPCCVTGVTPAGEAHHLKQGTGERGTGMRSSDRWAVPLSHAKHMELERQGSRNEWSWFRAHGITDPLELAAALWANTGDLPRMTKIVQAHMGRPSR